MSATYRPTLVGIRVLTRYGKEGTRALLADCIGMNYLLTISQRGYTSGRSTITNLLLTDNITVDCETAYDVINFDTKASCDTVPPSQVVDALWHLGVIQRCQPLMPARHVHVNLVPLPVIRTAVSTRLT